MENLCFFTDAPPLKENNQGNHGIACEFTKILGKDDVFLLTHRFRRSITKQNIIDSCHGLPATIYPDFSGIGFKRFAPQLTSKIDTDIFSLYATFILKNTLKRFNTSRFFVLCGADPFFLNNVKALNRTGLPVDIYLVDDIEESSRNSELGKPQTWVKPLIEEVVLSSDRVFTISKGFAEHLNSRFGCHAEWLPVPLATQPSPPKATSGTSSKKIIFTGGLNHLYAEPLRDLYEEISAINRELPMHDPFELHLLTYSDPESFLKMLPDRIWIKAFQNLPVTERRERMSTAYACFLPYSFEDSERLMVSTSFSCKILEYFSTGSPLFAYGPAYASIPRYFQEEGLPTCATSRTEIRSKLLSIENIDRNEAYTAYLNAWRRNHSPEAILSILSNDRK